MNAVVAESFSADMKISRKLCNTCVFSREKVELYGQTFSAQHCLQQDVQSGLQRAAQATVIGRSLLNVQAPTKIVRALQPAAQPSAHLALQ